MKKIFAALFAAVLMAAGLATFTMSSASAACPYNGCIPTSTFIDAPNEVEKGDRAKICVRVGTDGNGRPKGKVTITVVRGKGGFEFTDTKKYNDWKECFTTPPLTMRGNHVIKARFDKKPGSQWKDSDNRAEFRVTRG